MSSPDLVRSTVWPPAVFCETLRMNRGPVPVNNHEELIVLLPGLGDVGREHL